MNENKIISVYLGNQDKNYEKYYKLAKKNLDFTFLYSFSADMKKKLFSVYSFDGSEPSDDVMVILRHKSLINEYDPFEIVQFTNF